MRATSHHQLALPASQNELGQLGVLGEGADLVAHIGAVDRDERAFGPVEGGEADLLQEPLEDRVQPPRPDILDRGVDLLGEESDRGGVSHEGRYWWAETPLRMPCERSFWQPRIIVAAERFAAIMREPDKPTAVADLHSINGAVTGVDRPAKTHHAGEIADDK